MEVNQLAEKSDACQMQNTESGTKQPTLWKRRRAWDYLFKRQRGIRVENEIT